MLIHMQAKAPAYVVATNKDTKEFLLSVRGTSQMDDVITDIVAVPDEFDGTGEQAHSGMVQGAEWLFDRFLPLAQVLHQAQTLTLKLNLNLNPVTGATLNPKPRLSRSTQPTNLHTCMAVPGARWSCSSQARP